MKKLDQLMFDEFVKGLESDKNRYKYISKYGLKKRSRYSARSKLGWCTRRIKQMKADNNE